MRLLIIEQPLNNRGDEAAHKGLINSLLDRYPILEIDILFYDRKQQDIDYFKVASERVNYLNIQTKKRRIFSIQHIIKLIMMLNIPILLYFLPFIRKILSFYKNADYIMCAPGGMNLGGFQDWIHAAFLYLAVHTKKTVIYFARSIGPFAENTYLERTFKKQSLKLLNCFSYTSLRDNKSQEIAKQLNIKFISTVDSAFLSTPNINLPESITSKLWDNYIVVVPNSLTWHKDFKNLPYEFVKGFWSKLVDMLLDNYPNSQILMLPQTIGYSKLLADGYIYFNEIRDLSIHPERIFVLDEQYGSDIQQTIIRRANFLIGARYHSIIFAINQHIPFVSLSYEHKMTGILASLSLQQNEILIKSLLNDIYVGNISLADGCLLIINKINLNENIGDKAILANFIARQALQELDNILIKNL